MVKKAFVILGLVLWTFACSSEQSQRGGDEGVGGPDFFSLDALPHDEGPEAAQTFDAKEEVGGEPGPNFASPEGLALTKDYVFVANTNFSYEGDKIVYGEGFVTVVDRAKFAVVNRVKTYGKNPQVVAVRGGKLYVLCSGETTFDAEKGQVLPVGESTLEALDLAMVASAPKFEKVWKVSPPPPGSLVGYPSSLAFSPDGKYAYASSGTTAAIFKFDLTTSEVIRGSDNPIEVGDLTKPDTLTLKEGPQNILFLGSFNRDKVFAFDTSRDALAQWPFGELDVGKTKDIDGVLDLAYREGGTPDLFILLGLAKTVMAATTQIGQPSVKELGITGDWPNRIALWKGVLLVLNSGSNNITGFSVETGKDLGVLVVLPKNTNPYDMVVDGDLLYVTGLLSNDLTEIDLSARKVLRRVE